MIQPVSSTSVSSVVNGLSVDDSTWLEYEHFLNAKMKIAELQGFPCLAEEVNTACEPHQVDTVCWMVQGGRRGNFSWFSLGKTIEQLEVARLTVAKARAKAEAAAALEPVPFTPDPRALRALIICPLGVKQEFARDAVDVLKWASAPRFCRTTAEAEQPSPHNVYITNYDSVREGKIDPGDFTVVLLDEAAVLRGFGGSKTFRELLYLCTGDGGPSGRQRGKRAQYRFVSTATPAPNDYIELLAYAEFLGVMDISQAKTRFFKRDSTKADNLTLHPHKEREFWLWLSSWALFVTRPSDLGHSDEGYVFPPLEVHWHEVGTDHANAGKTKWGQHRLFANAAIGVSEAAGEKRRSLPARVAKLLELRAARPDDHCVVWHDLEDERHAIQKAIPDSVAVWGTMDITERERRVIGFSDGEFAVLSTKPRIAGAGTNFQRHCSWAVFFGVGFKFHDFIQAVYRLPRRGQTKPVRIDLIYTEAERDVRRILENKWRQHEEMVAKMTEIIRQYGLSHAAMAAALGRKMGVERVEAVDPQGRYRLVHWDSVLETRRMAEGSVDLVVTSIPFATQYEYSPNYSDFGHSEDNAAFFAQMDFLTPGLFRAMGPGRIAAVHVKDRIVPGGMTQLGFQTVYPFNMEVTRHYQKHGFAFIGQITVVTDVVRENNQTYRLGWTRQCEDATCMGVGMPEYILLFRKPQTDRGRSYADKPVEKSKADYTRSRWQIDAHGYWRSGGDRLLTPEELNTLPHNQIFQWFRRYSLENVYNLEHHVRTCETLELQGRLPTTFMLLQPQSWAPDVWADITRMRTMNTLAAQQGRQAHLCPLQFDIVDRLINRFSMPGETVYDPFAGVGTVPMRAAALGRVGVGCELNPAYWTDSAAYCRAAMAKMAMPGLFDTAEEELATEGTENAEELPNDDLPDGRQVTGLPMEEESVKTPESGPRCVCCGASTEGSPMPQSLCVKCEILSRPDEPATAGRLQEPTGQPEHRLVTPKGHDGKNNPNLDEDHQLRGETLEPEWETGPDVHKCKQCGEPMPGQPAGRCFDCLKAASAGGLDGVEVAGGVDTGRGDGDVLPAVGPAEPGSVSSQDGPPDAGDAAAVSAEQADAVTCPACGWTGPEDECDSLGGGDSGCVYCPCCNTTIPADPDAAHGDAA